MPARLIALLLLQFALAATSGAAQAEPAPAKEEEVDPDVLRKVRKLIQGTLSAETADRETAWKALKDMGNLAVPGLVAVYRQKTTTVEMTRSILIALGDSKDPRSGPALVEILGSPDALTRRDAARAIGDSNYKAGVPALEKVIADAKEDEEVRLFAAVAGAKLGSEPCIKSLHTLLDSPKPEIRSRAIFALGKFGGEAQFAAVEKGLADKDSSVREDAVEALRLIGKPAVHPALMKAVDDSDYKVRSAAMDALRQLTNQKIENDPDAWRAWWRKKSGGLDAEVRALVAQLSSEKFEEREAAMAKLKALGKPARSALEKALESAKDEDLRGRLDKLLLATDARVPLEKLSESEKALAEMAFETELTDDGATLKGYGSGTTGVFDIGTVRILIDDLPIENTKLESNVSFKGAGMAQAQAGDLTLKVKTADGVSTMTISGITLVIRKGQIEVDGNEVKLDNQKRVIFLSSEGKLKKIYEFPDEEKKVRDEVDKKARELKEKSNDEAQQKKNAVD